MLYSERRRWPVAEKNIQRETPAVGDRLTDVGYSATGHPSFEQLMAEQGTGPINDVSELHGDFWPEEESIEEFLESNTCPQTYSSNSQAWSVQPNRCRSVGRFGAANPPTASADCPSVAASSADRKSV